MKKLYRVTTAITQNGEEIPNYETYTVVATSIADIITKVSLNSDLKEFIDEAVIIEHIDVE